MTDWCRKCDHADTDHNDLGLCEVPYCRCVCFVSDSEEDEDDGSPEELELGE